VGGVCVGVWVCVCVCVCVWVVCVWLRNCCGELGSWGVGELYIRGGRGGIREGTSGLVHPVLASAFATVTTFLFAKGSL
jgi:hypothetical protein